MKLLLATKNDHKLMEFRRMLEPLGYTVLSQTDVDVDIDVEETGTTFEANAALKAQALYQATGLPTIADDSGLEIDALGGEPGVYSARYGGVATDTDRNHLVLQKMQGVPQEKRTARFVAALHLIFSADRTITVRGTSEGFIADKIVGDNGFGYDPIFMTDDTHSFATLTPSQKDAISHRGNALKLLCQQLTGEQ